MLPWKIPSAIPLPCAEGSSNATQFTTAITKADFSRLFKIQTSGSSKSVHALEVLFVDTHGHGRAVEVTARYLKWIADKHEKKEITRKPRVAYLAGGMAMYCNPQCFGRAIMNTPNAYG